MPLKILDVEIEVVEIPTAIEIIGIFDPEAFNRILDELSKYITPSEVEVNAKTIFDE